MQRGRIAVARGQNSKCLSEEGHAANEPSKDECRREADGAGAPMVWSHLCA